jgi:PAS domain S-box-containing protein
MIDEQGGLSQADILIVDDEPESLRLLIDILNKQGYETRPATDGLQALSAARLAPPDLILLDVMMPAMSGYEVCQALKTDEATRDIPVIFISALTGVSDKVRGFAVGGADYVAKPFQPPEVLARVETHLALRRMHQRLAEQNSRMQQLISERVRAEQALERQLALETIAATHASRFINLGIGKLDDEINDLLSALGKSSSVDGIFVLVFDSHQQQVEKHYQWFSRGRRPDRGLIRGLPLEAIPWTMERLSRFETIICEDVRDLPPEADWEREFLQAISVRSFLVIPLVVKNELVGCYGYHSAQPGTEWAVEDISLLRLLGHILSNVIDRRRTEERLRKLSQAVEQSPGPVLITDVEGNIEYVNPRFTQVTGYTAAEVLGRNPRLLKSGVHPAEFYADMWSTVASGQDWRSELVNRRKNGELYWEMSSISPLRNAAGEITHFIKVAEDITPRKEAEDSLRELQLYYQVLFERAPLGIVLTTVQGQVLAVNQAWSQITGYTQAEFSGLSASEMYQDPQDRERLLHRLRTEGFVPDYGVQLKRKNGTPYYANLHSSLIKRDDEDVVLTMVEDVTERRQFEEVLKKHNRALQALHQVSLEIGSELKMPILLHSIMEQAVALLDADRGGGIYMYEADENVLRLVEGTGINADRVGFVLQLNEGMAGQVFRSGNPLIVNDYTHWKGHATVLVSAPPSAVMGVPLLLDGQVIGVLGLIANSHRRTFAAEDVQLAELLAAQVGVAIKNARLYEQARHEIAERKQSEARYRILVEDMPALVCRFLPDGTLTFVNQHYSRYFDKPRQELEGHNFYQFIPEDQQEGVRAHYTSLSPENPAVTYEHEVVAPDGTIRWQRWTDRALFDETGQPVEYQAIGEDVTQAREARQRLEAALAEKETLLKEIHHRVKNNLQVISTILDLQAHATADERVRVAFQESQHRIQAMANIHEHLYRSRDLARIDMGSYSSGLVAELQRSYDTWAVQVQTEVSDVLLEVERAIPCGLIINELVSNAFKHAFPPERNGDNEIRVTMRARPSAAGGIELTVSDNGVGIPADVDLQNPATLGLTVVRLLVGQLGGSLEVDRSQGTRFRIDFDT